MSDNLLNRIERIAADVLPGRIRAQALGEDYYTFEITDRKGTKTALPHIWIDSGTKDREIRDKLRLAIETALHPETLPDDSSVPDLRTEGAPRPDTSR